MVSVAENIKINKPLTVEVRGRCRNLVVTTKPNTTMANLHTSEEVFLPIFGFEGKYEISNLGRVKSLERIVNHPVSGPTLRKGRFMSFSKNYRGYLGVSLCREAVKFKFAIQRLVAIHFVPNPVPDVYDQVNHKDGNKANNAAYNLEWCTGSQNSLHKYRVLGYIAPRTGVINKSPHMRSVIQLTNSGEEIRTYLSSADAARSGFNAGHISECCKGNRKTHKGFKWKYKI